MHSSNYQFNLIHCEHANIHCVCVAIATKGNAMRTEAINVFHFFPHFDLMKRSIQFVKFECNWRLTVDELCKSNHLFHYSPATVYLMICCQMTTNSKNLLIIQKWMLPQLITDHVQQQQQRQHTYSVRHMCKFDKYV